MGKRSPRAAMVRLMVVFMLVATFASQAFPDAASGAAPPAPAPIPRSTVIGAETSTTPQTTSAPVTTSSTATALTTSSAAITPIQQQILVLKDQVVNDVASGAIDSASIGTQLSTLLQNAADAEGNGSHTAAANGLSEFMSSLLEQEKGKHVTADAAQALNKTAEAIRATIEHQKPYTAPNIGSAANVSGQVTVTQNCSSGGQTIATFKAGDQVNGTATLSSGDPGENDPSSEDEHLQLAYPGGFTLTDNSYAAGVTFSFAATTGGPFTACITNADGDESATVQVTTTPLPSPHYIQVTKDLLSGTATATDIAGFGLSAAGVGCLIVTLGVCTPIAGMSTLLGFGLLMAGVDFRLLASDPPDSNYMVIATPNVQMPLPVVAGSGITAQEASAANALISNLAQQFAIGNALYTSINRAQGATQAGNSLWMGRQVQAANNYANQLAALINAAPGLLTNMRNALQAAGVNITITANDVSNIEQSISANGLSSQMQQTLSAYGADAATQTSIANLLIVQDPHAVAAIGNGQFPAMLTDPTLTSSLQGVAGTVTGFATPTSSGLQFYPLPSPVRLLDTRPGQSACVTRGAPIGGGSSLALNALIGCTGIPSSAQAVVGNATVVNNATRSPAGFATLYPGGGTLPLVSNLNYMPGDVIPNAVTVGLGSGGTFNVYASTTIDFIVDLSGYYAPPGTGGLYFHSLPTPVRLLDSRSGFSSCNARGAPLPAGGAINLAAATGCTGVPASAQAIVGNATVVNSTGAPGFTTLYPGTSSLPLVSNLNYVGGQVVPNAFTVGVSGSNGNFNVYSTVGIDLVIDIAGYYDTNSSGLLFTPLASPIRWLDTRTGTNACLGGAGPHAGGQDFIDTIAFTCGGVTFPSSAVAITGNATVIADAGGGPGYVTLHPAGGGLPNASNLNYVPGQVSPNAFITGLGNAVASDGTSYIQAYQIYASTTVDEIVDISGYFSSAAGGASSASTSAAGKAEPNTKADPKPGR